MKTVSTIGRWLAVGLLAAAGACTTTGGTGRESGGGAAGAAGRTVGDPVALTGPVRPAAAPAPAVAPLPAAAPALAALPGLEAGVAAGRTVTVDPTVWPWSAIGRLEMPDGTSCTGVLVGGNQVVTAADCLYDRWRDRYYEPARIVFAAGYGERYERNAGPQAVAVVRGRRLIAPAGYLPSYWADATAPRRRAADLGVSWGMLVLDGAVPVAPLRWLGGDPDAVAALAGAGAAVLAGYPETGPQVLRATLPCPLRAPPRGRGLLVHACESPYGDRGAPLLAAFGPGEVGVLWAIGRPSAITGAGP